MRRKPPDILITTPESLYLMITSQAREILTGVEAVIVDEIHAVAQSKRGAHLALTLERLSHLRRPTRASAASRSGSASRRPSARSSGSPSSSSARSASARSSTPASARSSTSRSSSRSRT